MKKLNVLFVLLSLVMAVSCGGDKKKSGGDKVAYYDFTQNPYQTAASSVVNGLFNPYTLVLEVGGQSYQLNQVYGISSAQTQQYPQQQYQQAYQSQPTVQAGQQYLYSAFQQIQQNQAALRPATQDGRYNVRVTYYLGRYAGMTSAVPVLTAPVVAF